MATLNYTAAEINALLAKADTAVQPETTGALADLTTTSKASLVAAIDELVSNEGSLTSLTTTQKASLVAAINELVTNDGTLSGEIGTLSSLSTTVKTSLVAAINELFQSVSDGKTTVAAAITDKGVTTAATATFSTMATNIGQLKPPTYIDPATAKNSQIAAGINRTANTSLTAITGQEITVSKAGTYHVYWGAFRSSTGSGTNGTQLYINGAAYGTENTTWSNHGQANHLSGVSLSKNDVVTVRARSRGSSYYVYVTDLTIIEA